MPTERYDSVINIDYLGSNDVRRYIADLERVGAISEKVANQLRTSVAGGLGGLPDQLGGALGVGAARMRDYDLGAQRMLATQNRLAEGTARLRREIQSLNNVLINRGEISSTQSVAAFQQQARRALYGVLEANAVNQRAATQGGLPLTPLAARPAGVLTSPSAPSGQMLALESAEVQQRRRALEAQQRYTRRVEEAIESRTSQIPRVSFDSGAPVIEGFVQEARDVTRSLAELDNRIESLSREVNETREQFLRSRTMRGMAASEAERINRDAYEARRMAGQLSGDSISSVPDMAPVGNRMFWRDGIANREVLGEFGLDHRAWLIGETSGDPLQEYRGILRNKTQGLPVPGFTSQAQLMRDYLADFDNEKLGDYYAEIDRLKARRDDLALGRLDPTTGFRGAIPSQPDGIALGPGPMGRAQTALTAAFEQDFAEQQAHMQGLGRSARGLNIAHDGLTSSERKLIAAHEELVTAERRRAAQLAAGGGMAGGGGGGVGGTPPPPPPSLTPPSGPTSSGDWVDALEQMIAAQEKVIADPIEKLRARQLAAQNAYDEVVARGDKGIGVEGGYKTVEARDAAYLRARQGLTAAEVALARALDARAEAEKKATATTVQTTQTQAALNAANQRATAYAQAAGGGAGTPPGGGGPGGGFFGDFRRGFYGERNSAPYAEQLGQTFKFSVMYGTAYQLLTAFTGTMAATLQEGIAFQQAVTELEVASGAAAGSMDAIAEQLGASATAVGFAPSQGILVGAKSLGLYGATQAPVDEQRQIATISAEVVNRLAFTSGMQPEDIQTNIAAITSAFGLGAEGQYRVADLDAYFGKEFGTDPGQTIQAVSEAGTVGRAAGFSQEYVNAIAANMIARTGQTPSAVAGFMAQIFSRGGEGSLTAVSSRYGIDPRQELAEQIEQLAQVYKTAAPNERAEISAAFGRGKVQNAAIALLQDYDAVQEAAEAARSGAADGKGAQAAELRLGNIGGQIALTSGALKDFAGALGESGVLDVLGAGVVVFRELLEAGTSMLRVWNEIPGPIKATVLGLTALALATRAAAGSTALQGALGISRTGALAGGGFAVTRAGASVPLASGAGAAAVTRNALGSARFLGAVGLAIGGLYAVGELAQTSREMKVAQERATSALTTSTLTPGLSTPDDVRARATMLTETAGAERDAASGWAARVYGLGQPRAEQLANAERLETEADRLAALADRLDERAPSAELSLITGFDTDSITSGFDAIQSSGGTAREQLDALRAALLGTADAASRASASFDPELFASENAQGVFESILGQDTARVLKRDGSLADLPGPGGRLFGALGADGGDWKDITDDLLMEQLEAGDVQTRLAESLAGVGSLADLSPQDMRRIASKVVGDSADALGADQGGSLSGSEVEVAREAMIAQVVEYLEAQRRGVKDMIEGDVVLTQSQLDAVVASSVETSNAILDGLAETDFKGRTGQARQLVRTIRQAIARTSGGASAATLQQLGIAERALAEAQFDQLEAMRRAAQQNARSRAEVARIGRNFLRRELRAAIRGGNQDLLAQIIGQAGGGAIAIAEQIIKEAISAARAAMDLYQRSQALRQKFGDLGASTFMEEPEGVDPALRRMLDSLDTTAVSAGDKEGNVYLTGSDVPGYEAPAAGETAAEKAEKDRETAAERAAALAAANAVRSESSIGAARADIMAAQAAMATAKKGTVEYYNALGSYYAARNSLTDAILEYRQNRYLLGIDITDPLAQAEAQLKAARDKLASDRGKGADVVAADRVALQEAQAAAEAARFNQRLQTVQTAEQLGRISHGAYIRYLENEQQRLERIKDRTYQQQEQLNQIDGLLQDAASSMDAQFNFGDIRLPTPYQVRRSIEERVAGLSAELVAGGRTSSTTVQSTNTTTIYIDGADIAKVKRILKDELKNPGRVRTAQPRRGRL